MTKIKVSQMTSPRSGNHVANQFEIYTPKGRYFQSYRSIIAFVPREGKIQLDEYYHDYSRTTSKYLTQFLGLNTLERKALAKEGAIKFTNLNK